MSRAADGTWTLLSAGSATGNWDDATTANWSGGTVAGGSGFTADFSTLDITAASTVTLTAPRTIGNLVFGDSDTTSAASWTLAGTSPNILTLAGTTPTITVNAMSSVTNTGANVTISAIIAGTNGLTKNGTGVNTTATNNTTSTGTLVLSGANTYTGATNINTGTIRATNASAFGGVAGGKLATNIVNVANGARLQLGAVTIANTVNLNGTTALSVVSGSSVLSGIVNLQSNSAAYVHNGGNYTLTFSGALNLSDYVLDSRTTGSSNGMIISGTLTGSSLSGITKNGAGPLTMSGDGSGYSGTTTLNTGELAVGSNTGLGTGTFAMNAGNDAAIIVRSTGDATSGNRTSAAAVTLIGANANSRFLFGSTNNALNGGLTFTNTTGIALAATRKIDVYNITQFDAPFTGAGGINFNAPNTGSPAITQATGTLILNGVNTYAGATTINAGTLLVTGSKTGAGVVTVNSTGTLGGTGTIAGATTVASGAFLSAGASSGAVGTLTFSSTLDISGLAGGTGGLLFNLAGTGASDKIVSGALTIGTGVLDINDFSFTTLAGYGVGTYTLLGATSIVGTLGSNLTGTVGGLDAVLSISGNDLVLTVSSIPEPSTYAALAGLGVLGLAAVRRRRTGV